MRMGGACQFKLRPYVKNGWLDASFGNALVDVAVEGGL